MKTLHHSRTSRLLILLALALAPFNALAQGSLTPPGPPAPTMLSLSQIEPRTPISSVPITISKSGSYYFTTNLAVPTSEVGIFISANNVTLDLNGFTLTGVGNLFDGIDVTSTQSNIVVRNGALNNWANGISADPAYNLQLERLRISNIEGYGVVLSGSSTVRNCMFQGSTSPEFDAVFVSGGLVSDCVISGFAGNGIEAQSSQVRNCLIVTNGGSGMLLDGNCQVVGNTLIANTGTTNIDVVGNDNRIEDNHVVGSAGFGIVVPATASNNIIVKNSVEGFGAKNYFIAAGNDAGPIGFASTNTSPWGNISH